MIKALMSLQKYACIFRQETYGIVQSHLRHLIGFSSSVLGS